MCVYDGYLKELEEPKLQTFLNRDVLNSLYQNLPYMKLQLHPETDKRWRLIIKTASLSGKKFMQKAFHHVSSMLYTIVAYEYPFCYL